MAAVVCGTCGRRLPNGSAYCGACGAAVPTVNGSPAGTVRLAEPSDVPLQAAEFTLVVALPGRPEQLYPIGATLRVGRDPAGDIVVDDPAFPALDLEVFARHGTYVIRDRRQARALTASGVKVNEALLTADEPVYAPNRAGRAVSFRLRPLARGHGIGRSGAKGLTIRFPPDSDSLTIGRDPANDVVIDYPIVSRLHAEIERLDRHVLLRDHHSANGSFVAGHRVRGLQELQVGDEIQIGPVRFIFQGEAIEQVDDQPSVRVDAAEVTVRAGRRGRAILDHASISALPGEFVALIGGSGAGKSTLLHALAGVVPPAEGRVLYNGRDIYRSANGFGGLIGYVPQDDILHRDLSARHALEYGAQLRLPPDTSESERERRIESVLTEVQMMPQKNQQVSRLSGGQRKRVSIALELLANPSILFLDEPTSGLDPGLDKAVMRLLRGLCEQGRTIFLGTHATENIGQCDLVAFLSGGRLIYYGPPAEAPGYFGVEGYPDIYTMLADAKTADKEEIRFRGSPLYRTYVLERQAGSRVPAASEAPSTRARLRPRSAATRQWRILTHRYAELVRRDRVNLALLLAQTPIVACALAVVTSRQLYTAKKLNNTQQVLLMLVVATLWFCMSNAAREIVKERAIYLRERLVNLRLFPYILSKAVVLTVLGILQVIGLFWIVRLKTPHLPAQGILMPAPLEMMISLVLCAVAGLLGGLLISSLVRTTDRAMALVPIVLIPQVIFSGAVFDMTGWSKVLSYLTLSHWCLAALGSTVRINDLATGFPGSAQAIRLTAGNSDLPDVTGGWPKEMYASPDQAHLLGYWAVLGLWSVLFLAAIYVALRRADRGISARRTETAGGRLWLYLLAPPVIVCGILALISAR